MHSTSEDFHRSTNRWPGVFRNWPIRRKLLAAYEEQHIPRETATERVRHVMQSTFNGRRIVIFSGGAKTDDSTILDEVRAIRAGGGFGSIMGRNSFQRDRSSALGLLDHIIRIYRGETP